MRDFVHLKLLRSIWEVNIYVWNESYVDCICVITGTFVNLSSAHLNLPICYCAEEGYTTSLGIYHKPMDIQLV